MKITIEMGHGNYDEAATVGARLGPSRHLTASARTCSLAAKRGEDKRFLQREKE